MRKILFMLMNFVCAGCAVQSVPNLRIAVTGDAQAVPFQQHWGMVNTEKAFRFLAPFKPDVLVQTGDLSDRAYPEVYPMYMECFRRNFSGRLPVQVACAGNHDFWSVEETAYDELWNNFADGLGISRENPCRQTIGGYDFITMTEEHCETYSGAMLARLKVKLDEAVARDSGKPFFVITHFAPENTMLGSQNNRRSAFRELLNNYPQAVSLSGHTHIPLELETSFWQGEFSALQTSTLSYGCITGNFANNAGKVILPYAREVQQALLIDIFDDRVEIRRYNVHEKRELGGGSLWRIDIPYDRKKAEFAALKRQESAVAPEFPENAELLVRHDFGFVYLLFPPAIHEKLVYGYKVKFFEKAGDGSLKLLNESRYIGDFYRYEAHRSQEVSVKVPENIFLKDRVVRAEVYPFEDYGKCGRPLVLEMKSPWDIVRSAVPAYPVE
ncbi:MAG: metallophosphoesterase [Lentisphaeria bacterium]|nr:metallophosphoesterase [Lentisphaeria bacterium]